MESLYSTHFTSLTNNVKFQLVTLTINYIVKNTISLNSNPQEVHADCNKIENVCIDLLARPLLICQESGLELELELLMNVVY